MLVSSNYLDSTISFTALGFIVRDFHLNFEFCSVYYNNPNFNILSYTYKIYSQFFKKKQKKQDMKFQKYIHVCRIGSQKMA